MSKGIRRFDYLVLGSGIAGLTYAIRVSKHGHVAVITKKGRAVSNTNFAQGGVAAVLSAADSYDLHIKDTIAAGCGLSRRAAVEVMVREGPERIRELMAMGTRFTTTEQGPDLAREGGHSVNRIVHAGDLTGREIERSLLEAVSENADIEVFENHVAIDLVTEHHLARKSEKTGKTQCWGAYVLDSDANRVELFTGKTVLLSTGGLGHVYLHTTNPSIATGDGVAMAYRAGARTSNMEFIQFHPTALYRSGNPAFLISEAVRGFGGILKTLDGQEFMDRYDSRKSLAPRDIVAYAIDTELKTRGEEHVLLDLRHLAAAEIKSHFPHIYKTCLTDFKIDITAEPIPVVPAAHYSCGGVDSDIYGRTGITGLFVAGEASMTGVHGANRLASNSLLEALVFSARAATASIEFQNEASSGVPEFLPWNDSGTLNSEEWILIAHNRLEIQQVMWDYVGIVRSDLRLERALRRIQLVRNEVELFYRRTRVSEGLIELRNLALCAELIVRSSMLRKETRGLFVTTDYPRRDDDRYLNDSVVS